MKTHADVAVRQAWRLVLLFGVVSLLADLTYEGARSLIGPYLGWLGASAVAVGVVAGAGELVGYSLRLLSGYLSDRTRRYWTFTLLGYGINLLAVPALALAGRWEVAAALVVAERIGKALRTPARDALLAHATVRVGHGRGFGLHEALDQIGAVAGPLLLSGLLLSGSGYRTAFAVLIFPALLALAVLGWARLRYSDLSDASSAVHVAKAQRLPRPFWLYLAGAALLAAGYVDFPLIAYHFRHANVLAEAHIPLIYAWAMAVDAFAAVGLGVLFDRQGMGILAIATVFAAVAAPFVFWGGPWAAWVGMALWGVGMGAQESILRASLAQIIPPEHRGRAFGIFHAVFGLFWFAGSAGLGLLYATSRWALVAVATGLQLGAAVLFGLFAVHPKR